MDRIKPVLTTPISEVTATTTSSVVNVENAKKVTLLFTRANHSAGSSLFEVLASVDSSTFASAMMIKTIEADAGAGTAGEDIGYTRALNTTLSANGSEVLALDLKYHNFKEIKLKVTETTDGTHTAKVLCEF